jgi:hypothetical protein
MADRGKQAAASDMPSRRRAFRAANAFAATAIGHRSAGKYLAAPHGKPAPRLGRRQRPERAIGDDCSAEIISYKPGTWEWDLERHVAAAQTARVA